MRYQIGDMVPCWSYAANAYETGYVVAVDGQGRNSVRVRFFKGFDRIVYADRRLKRVKEEQ